jgi:hypothetical protein
LAGDFNVNAQDNFNAELAEFMKDTFELSKRCQLPCSIASPTKQLN